MDTVDLHIEQQNEAREIKEKEEFQEAEKSIVIQLDANITTFQTFRNFIEERAREGIFDKSPIILVNINFSLSNLYQIVPSSIEDLSSKDLKKIKSSKKEYKNLKKHKYSFQKVDKIVEVEFIQFPFKLIRRKSLIQYKANDVIITEKEVRIYPNKNFIFFSFGTQ